MSLALKVPEAAGNRQIEARLTGEFLQFNKRRYHQAVHGVVQRVVIDKPRVHAQQLFVVDNRHLANLGISTYVELIWI